MKEEILNVSCDLFSSFSLVFVLKFYFSTVTIVSEDCDSSSGFMETFSSFSEGFSMIPIARMYS